MATKTNFALKGKTKDTYLELVLQFPLASIKSDVPAGPGTLPTHTPLFVILLVAVATAD